MELTVLPESLLLIGGAYVGLEQVQAGQVRLRRIAAGRDH
jgi:pyruvate/2-oxoglutarate dehydrogenase complex dihydrolipoamide dehydrogenase (E3) component